MLKLCLTKMEELDSLQVDLKINCHDLSPSCWRKKWDHIKNVQVRCLTSFAQVNVLYSTEQSVTGQGILPLGRFMHCTLN
jgi:hypothetical protein